MKTSLATVFFFACTFLSGSRWKEAEQCKRIRACVCERDSWNDIWSISEGFFISQTDLPAAATHQAPKAKVLREHEEKHKLNGTFLSSFLFAPVCFFVCVFVCSVAAAYGSVSLLCACACVCVQKGGWTSVCKNKHNNCRSKRFNVKVRWSGACKISGSLYANMLCCVLVRIICEMLLKKFNLQNN